VIDATVRRRHSRWWLVAALPFSLLAFATASSAWALAFIAPVIIAFVLTHPRITSSRVEVTGEGVRVDGDFYPRARFTAASLLHEGRDTFVALRGKNAIDIAVPNNVEGDAIIRALGLDAAHATASYSVRVAPSRKALALFAIALAPSVFAMLWMLLLGSVAFLGVGILSFVGALILFETARRATLRVGADGLVIAPLAGRGRFLPHDAITNVERERNGISLTTTTGETLHVKLPPVAEGREAAHDDELANMMRRIGQAQRAFRAFGGATPELATVLDRNARATRDWLADLRRVGEGAQSAYRDVTASREALFALVESATADVSARIAAAIALKKTLTDEEKPRVRVAAERCVHPELRERLVRVIETDDDAELERALDASDDASQSAPKS